MLIVEGLGVKIGPGCWGGFGGGLGSRIVDGDAEEMDNVVAATVGNAVINAGFCLSPSCAAPTCWTVRKAIRKAVPRWSPRRFMTTFFA